MITIKDRMDKIQSIFVDSKENGVSVSNHDELYQKLVKVDQEFISIAFEGASMGLATRCLKETDSLDEWFLFHEKYCKDHSTQFMIGLGWAFSELELLPSLYIDKCSRMEVFSVYDGYGYHEARFKKRLAIRKQRVPEGFDGLAIRSYDQGLGRSFLNAAKGNWEKIIKLVSIFPESRHADLWRGIGVSITYIIGIDLEELKAVLINDKVDVKSLKAGVALVIKSRSLANTISEDTEVISQLILNKSCTEVAQTISLITVDFEKNPDNNYTNWIENIEVAFC